MMIALRRSRFTALASLSALFVTAFFASSAPAADPPPPTPDSAAEAPALSTTPTAETLAPLPEAAPPPLPAAEPTSMTSTTSADTTRGPERDRPPNEETPIDTRGMKRHDLDVRMALNADALLAYLGVGVNADFGLVRMGSGTLAVGGGIESDFCGTVCWAFSSQTPIDFSHRQISAQARASYHLGLTKASKVDLYPFVGVGPVFSRSEINVDHGAARYIGTDTTVGISMGLGASYFFGKGPFFVGGEGRIRYAGGTYDYRLDAGDGKHAYDSSSVEAWSLTGIDALVAVGVRIP